MPSHCQISCKLTPSELEARKVQRTTRSNTTRAFLVGKHLFGHHCLTGRGTKGYAALELPGPGMERPQLRFMKDYWRPVQDRIHPELETYERLRANHVDYVPTAIAGGDVVHADGSEQVTVTQERMAGEKDAPLKRKHYRVVILELGRPLHTFTLFDDFIGYVLDALTGMFCLGFGSFHLYSF